MSDRLNLDFAADLPLARPFLVGLQSKSSSSRLGVLQFRCDHRRRSASRPVLLNASILVRVARWLCSQPLQGEPEGFDGTLQALQQVHRHEGLQAFFAIKLFEPARRRLSPRCRRGPRTWQAG